MSAGTEAFLRMLQQRQQAAPVPMSNIQRPYQLPGGRTPPMALSGLQKAQAAQLARGTGGPAPRVLPMLADIAQGKYISPLQKALMQKATEQPAAPTAPQGDQAQTTFGQRFSQPTTQALLGAAVEGADASGWSRVPVSTGQVLARMGAGAMKAYGGALEAQERARKAKIDEEYTRAKTRAELTKTGQAFSGTSMSAQSANTVLNLADKISNGTATPKEEQIYALAYSNLARPRIQTQFDEQGNEIRTEIPAYDLSKFPSPSGVGAGGPEPITTKKPTADALKDKRVVKTLGTMIKNLNVYRESLADPEFDRGDQLSGIVGVPTAEAARASGQAEALRLDLKNLYELGALVGGDFQILDRLLTAPSTGAAAASGKENLIIQLEQLERQLENKLAEKGVELEGTISKPIVANSKEAYDKAPAYSYVRLPNGSVVLKGAK